MAATNVSAAGNNPPLKLYQYSCPISYGRCQGFVFAASKRKALKLIKEQDGYRQDQGELGFDDLEEIKVPKEPTLFSMSWSE